MKVISKLNKKLNGITIGALLVSSSSYVLANDYSSIPQWVLMPAIENGIAAVDCVEFSGNISSDAKMAAINARVALSQQIEAQIESVDQVFEQRNSSEQSTTTSSSFSSTAKQMSKQVLRGSSIVRSEVVKILNKNYLCSMATLQPEQTTSFFTSLITQMKLKLPQTEQQQLMDTLTTPSQLAPNEQIDKLIKE